MRHSETMDSIPHQFLLQRRSCSMEIRCNKIHKKVKWNETEQSRLRINSKVSDLYTMEMGIGYRDWHQMLYKTLEEKQQESLNQLGWWVANTTTSIKHAAHDFKRHNKAKTKDIRHYFGAHISHVQKHTPRKRRKTTRVTKYQANTSSIANQPTWYVTAHQTQKSNPK